MAESSIFWDTDGTGDGTDTGYTDTQLFELYRSLFTRSANYGGVAPDMLNELAVSGTATPVAVASGAGIVYGIPYFNSASVNVAIATPATLTRVDRIVLRADWTAQTVRITRIAGTEGAGTPAMTQTPGTTWDVPLATASITTGGVITVTDAREWLGNVGDGTIAAVKLAADSVTTAKILDSNVTAGKLASDSVTTIKILDSNVTAAKLSSDSVTTIKILDDNVTTAKIAPLNVTAAEIAADAVTTAKILDDNVTGAKIANYAINPRAHISGTNGIVVDPQNGNSRGDDSVDLQTLRSNNDEVASGARATIGGGSDNKANGDYTTIAGGYDSIASDSYATIGGGTDNTASGNSAVVAGGTSNAASGAYSSISGGRFAVANKQGQIAHTSTRFAANGDAQRSVYVVAATTTNATPTEMFLNVTSGHVTIAQHTTWFFRADIVARRQDADNESAGYTITGVIDNNAGTTALVGTITKTVTAEDTAGWDVTATADNTNDALVFTATGENAKTIYWVAAIYTVEVTG
jgi:hypothetical protein